MVATTFDLRSPPPGTAPEVGDLIRATKTLRDPVGFYLRTTEGTAEDFGRRLVEDLAAEGILVQLERAHGEYGPGWWDITVHLEARIVGFQPTFDVLEAGWAPVLRVLAGIVLGLLTGWITHDVATVTREGKEAFTKTADALPVLAVAAVVLAAFWMLRGKA